jgi:hypothetical protein
MKKPLPTFCARMGRRSDETETQLTLEKGNAAMHLQPGCGLYL